MFASRFRPAFQTATRSFTSATAAHQGPSISVLQTARRNVNWQRAWQQGQSRGFARSRPFARQQYNYSRFQQTSGLLRRWAARPTFYYEVGAIAGGVGVLYVVNLEEVPVSGRRRFNVFAPSSEVQMSEGFLEDLLKQYRGKIMPAHSREHQLVQKVLQRLIPHSGLEDQKWETFVINDNEKNAFVIPGGKVFVHRGILDVCQGEEGIATVLSHEISHNVAHHAAERISQQIIVVLLGLTVATIAGGDFFGLSRFLSNLVFTLPGSRTQESEADYIGLMMMAESCYNPNNAIAFWGRMEKLNEVEPPQFLSTHPGHHARLEKIREWLPQAETKLENSDCGATAMYANQFRSLNDFSRW